ncbi:NAD(P)/FAD-dependent oxidoreductase [Mycobacterium sp. IDR2000157661]|uniref:NAD(P)/FAD-dependent oxidoreductase n=1 Tax=Mycobacterium sp. IDR2000157661 TaxID=2867005 RepID=UPI001EEC666A|nr:FAD/NAD(P)-binding oxidoreductase [Mycobacterium sp. IDR2000157661]ULE34552.1 NAD(P)/FAD-dependent oxidoreductase [Mycobacterium sp. IDR2000157661]
MASDRALTNVVVVGTGVAGTAAAEELRRSGYDGELTIVGAERHAPYHRPPLSKKMLAGTVHRAGIDLAPNLDVGARVLRETSAVGLDMASRTVRLRDGDTDTSLEYDGLVIAGGAVPRPWPGGDVPGGVLLLRTVEDCLAIRERLASRPRVAVIGGGFIGAEVAATCRLLGLDVVLIDKGDAPLQSALGHEMAQCWGRLHRAHGVDLRTGVSVDAFVGDGQVEAVRLSDGSTVPADLVVVGLGVRPATDWLEGSGVPVDNGVLCGANGAVDGCNDLVAAGDIARWWHPRYERHVRIEHWEHARGQGATAARTLLAGPQDGPAFDELPYFWSDQYDVKLQMLGTPMEYDAVSVIDGDPGTWEFVAAYGRNGRTVAVLSTVPGRVNDYRDAIAAGAEFPPRPAA